MKFPFTTQNLTLTPRGENFQSANVWGPGELQKLISVWVSVKFWIVKYKSETKRLISRNETAHGQNNFETKRNETAKWRCETKRNGSFLVWAFASIGCVVGNSLLGVSENYTSMVDSPAKVA